MCVRHYTSIGAVLESHTLFLIPTILPLSLYAHRVLGTPTDATWPGVTELPDFKQTFPRWTPKPMVQVIPKLGSEGRDLLLVSFVYTHAAPE